MPGKTVSRVPCAAANDHDAQQRDPDAAGSADGEDHASTAGRTSSRWQRFDQATRERRPLDAADEHRERDLVLHDVSDIEDLDEILREAEEMLRLMREQDGDPSPQSVRGDERVASGSGGGFSIKFAPRGAGPEQQWQQQRQRQEPPQEDGVEVHALQGWQVVDVLSGQHVGVVQSVVELNPAKPYLGFNLVVDCNSSHWRQYSSIVRLPLVDSVVVKVDPKSCMVGVKPPEGLLEISGVIQQGTIVREDLRRKLLALCEAAAANPSDEFGRRQATRAARGQQFLMPSAAWLRAQGEGELLSTITRVGGPLHIGNELGFHCRKPQGYWDDVDILEDCLGEYVAQQWVRQDSLVEARQFARVLRGADGEEEFGPGGEEEAEELDSSLAGELEEEVYINLLTLEICDGPLSYEQASAGYVEPQLGRHMPRREELQSAGRWDLHNAIMAHGGYIQVAEELDRQPGRSRATPPTAYAQFESLLSELELIAEELGERRMPTNTELLAMGRSDLRRAIARHGGASVVAQRADMPTKHSAKGRWDSIDHLAAELRRFNQQHRIHGRMPKRKELLEAGRGDLRYALGKFGASNVADYMGLAKDKRGRTPKKL